MTPDAPGKRRHWLRAVTHGVLFAALTAGVFGLLAQLGLEPLYQVDKGMRAAG
jgi:hypothetical protein